MSEKERLHHLLDTTRAETERLLAGLDWETVIYAEEEWRIQDIIGHLTAWEQASITSLQAFLGGGESWVGLEDDDYNARNVARRYGFSRERIVTDWGETRVWLKELLNQVSEGMWSQTMLHPDNTRQSVMQLFEDAAAHEIEHRDDILKVTGGS